MSSIAHRLAGCNEADSGLEDEEMKPDMRSRAGEVISRRTNIIKTLDQTTGLYIYNIDGIDQAASEIIAETEKAIPNKRLPNGTYSYDEIKGYNECRDEIRHNLGLEDK